MILEAAAWLGVSQPYLSLLENGARPLTDELRERLKIDHHYQARESKHGRIRARLSALGYPGFSHVPPDRSTASASALLMEAISEADLDTRVTAALPWLARMRATELDLCWLLRQAKLRDLQNRLGFLLEMAMAARGRFPTVPASMIQTREELSRARLLAESTFCWDSMPVAARRWIRGNRTPEAAYWNVVTRMRPEDVISGE